ncbi:hypothetical protein HJC03_06115 [Rhizobium sp. NLR4b]|uniref:hypothetical protein n=1 Tax=Rhizobium sp. NLR4b TaxID=2731118 RepID=UPI001C8361C5|nr:hypothetical protein [Rhizobium sp. NLR4b]MBX5249976.1 hypothetical protein [Rhizobium sp. NLR4b]
MMLLAIKVESSNVAAILSAISALVPPQQIELYDLVQPPKSPADDGLEELARKVALAVRPTATKPMRREALQKLARGHDTFCDQSGEADPALRNAMGAISKDLRSVFSHEKPIQRLAISRKTRMADGSYKGTVYDVTPLGARVFELLKSEGHI